MSAVAHLLSDFLDLPKLPRLAALAAFVCVLASPAVLSAMPQTPAELGEAPLPRLAVGSVQIDAPAGTHPFDYTGTTRGAYGEIARQFGLTATFDGDLTDRQIRFRVSDVDFATAMRLLSEETTTFWRALDSKSFFVMPDTPAKRRDYDPEVQQVIELPASETNDDMTETMRMVREIVGVRRADLDTQNHLLTVRDTPQNVALTQALVKEIEQARGELLLEIDILEVDRTLAQDIGITPPSTSQTLSITPSDVTQLTQAFQSGTLVQAIETLFGSLTGSGATSSFFPPLIAIGGGRTIFFATVPGASGNFSRTLSAVQDAQRVLLRVADGKPATFFVGERYPITLALLSSSLVTAATQFLPGVLPGTFPRTDYDVGTNPSGVAIADFNNDGRLDLAVVNKGDNTVSILLGNGDGTFGTAVTYPTGNGPVAVVTADFNADGKLDLAVVNQTDNTVSILLGNGDGTFGAPTAFPTGKMPVAIAMGNFNASTSGNLDLAVVNQSDNTVSILLGNGDGTFAAKQDFTVGTTPSSIVTDDFNNDGILDLAVTNSAANTFSMLLGKGDGTFPTRTDYTTGNGPSSIAAADFNADGRLDVAVTNETDNTVSIFTGNGDGTFATTITNYDTGTTPVAVLATDVNLDGQPDLLVANQGASTVSVFLNLGGGTLASAVTLSTGSTPVAIAAAALNTSSSLPDLVSANSGANTISVILDNSSGLPVSNSGSPTTTYPASEYVDLGLKVQATPRLHPNDEVTLAMQFDISSLAGSNENGIPILSNRTVQQTLRLRENQTSVLSGIMSSSEMNSVTGAPGLASVPVVGLLAGDHSKQTSETELLIAITPRQLRLAPRTDATIYAGRGPGAAPAAAPGAAPAPPGLGPGAAPAPPGAVGGPPAPPVTTPLAQPPTNPGGAPPAEAPPASQAASPADQPQPPQPAPQ